MKQFLTISVAALLCGQSAALAHQQQQQTPPRPAPTPRQQVEPQRTPQRLDLLDYGVRIEPDRRLIVLMAALDAAGWEPTPAGAEPSAFRALVRKDQAELDAALRGRMQDFFKRNRLPDPPPSNNPPASPPSPAEQAARYVTLALALGQPPALEAPPRSDDLPGGLLEVLDFAPLVREFYRRSGIDARLPAYAQAYRAEGERLRRPTVEMARGVLSYLNTRPVTSVVERAEVPAPAAGTDGKKKKEEQKKVAVPVREKERRFLVVPDLLAAPGTVNFRVIGDDYYAIVPAGTDPRASELRRAYIQFVVDPLVLRFGRDVAAKRAGIKQVLDAERARTGRDLTPDVFLTVARSLVAAADVRMDQTARRRALQLETSERLKAAAADEAARARILAEAKQAEAAVDDAATAALANAYERGAVLSFYFGEQLRGLEDSGFDLANFVPDMIASIDPARETRRPAEYAAAVARFEAARLKAREEAASRAGDAAGNAPARPAALVRGLKAVEEFLRAKDYTAAEERLNALRGEFRSEPLIYLALGQTASLSAQDAFDNRLQAERLTSALGHFRQAVIFASPAADRTVIFRARLASARILAFLDRREEALSEFDAALAAGDRNDHAYREALAERQRLAGPQ